MNTHKAWRKGGNFVVLLFLLLSFFGGSTVPVTAQTESEEEFKLFFVIDSSGSMAEGIDPNFPKVKGTLKETINLMEDGMGLYILPFGEKGFANPLNLNGVDANDRLDSGNFVDGLKATGQLTALWDGIYSALDAMSAYSSNDVTLSLVVYTDGKDNASEKTEQNCIDKFNELRSKNPNVYWVWYVLEGAEISDNLMSQTSIDFVEGFEPISIVRVKPGKLNLGNIYDAGMGSGCLTIWYSDPDLYGKVVEFGTPMVSSGYSSLPEGMFLDIVPRSLSINQKEQCVTLKIVNYDAKQIAQLQTSAFSFDVPVIVSTETTNHVFSQPKNLTVKFDLKPGDPEVCIHSNNGSPIDLGDISKPKYGESASVTGTLDLGWKNPADLSKLVVQITLDQTNPRDLGIPQEIGLAVVDQDHASSFTVTQQNDSIQLVTNFSSTTWNDLETGSYTYSGIIKFVPYAVKITCPDVDNTTGEIPFTFDIVQSETSLTVNTPTLSSSLDLGTIKQSSPATTAKWNLFWDEEFGGQEQAIAEIVISGNDNNDIQIGQNIGFVDVEEDELLDFQIISTDNSTLTIGLDLPYQVFHAWPVKERLVEGYIVVTPKNLTNITNGTPTGDEGGKSYPFSFTIKTSPPIYLIVIFITVVGLILFALFWLLLHPRWPKDIIIEIEGRKVDPQNLLLGLSGKLGFKTKILFGKGNDVDVTLSGVNSEKIVAFVKPTMGTCLVMKWLKKDLNAKYKVVAVEDTKLLNRSNVSLGDQHYLVIPKESIVISNDRKWTFVIK